MVWNPESHQDRNLPIAECKEGRGDGAALIGTCRVCQKILSLFQNPINEVSKVRLGSFEEILKSECPHVKWFQDIRAKLMDPGPLRSLTMMKFATHTAVSLGVDDWSRVYQDVELIDRPGNDRYHAQASVLDSDWVNITTVSSWVKCCVTEHGGKCTTSFGAQAVSYIHPEWLIDVVDGCIVPGAGVDGRYVTLSYTWGQTKNLRNTKAIVAALQRSNSLIVGDFADQLPNTIRDAIWLVSRLGEDYLWVDSLCIIQDSTDSLSRNLNLMYLIYANSYFCIVAEAGEDANFGLRGLSGCSRPRDAEQILIDLAHGEQLTCIQEPNRETWQGGKREFGSGHYHKRGWTFQEYMFANRKLVFGKGPVRWLCRCTQLVEHLKDIPFNGSDNSFTLTPLGMIRAGIKVTSRVPTITTIVDLVRAYNERSLRYPEDTLPAFSGVQTFLNGVYPGGLIYGHPKFFFDISLLWWQWGEIRRRESSEYFVGDPLLNKLPSWSWMGWHGNIMIPGDSNFEKHQWHTGLDGYTNPITKFYAMSHPESPNKQPIVDQWYKYSQNTEMNQEWCLGWTKLSPRDRKRKQPSWEGPQRDYVHTSNKDETFGYPVPEIDTNKSAELCEQTQYLHCATSRAFFFATKGRRVIGATLLVNAPYPYAVAIRLGCKDGNFAGVLCPSYQDDLKMGNRTGMIEAQVELTAIFQGWTKRLNSWEAIDQDEIPAHDRDEEKVNCYFVLWIRWVNGVAYRQGCGVVLRSAWERCKEDTPLELTLG